MPIVAQYDCSSCNYWCDAVLGCLSWTADWADLIFRPLSPTPLTRNQIGVTFTLYTRLNPTAVINNLLHRSILMEEH